MAQSIQFFGAAQTVTGSRHLLHLGNAQVLVDCGLFQGSRELRERNWQPLPFAAHELDAVILTHAHLDHLGWLPRLIKQGYQGKVFATPATIGLARISLPDSGRIQEEDARQANRRGSRHQPALPLYTEDDAYDALKALRPIRYETVQDLPGGASFQFLPAGHILGSAFADVRLSNGQRLLMSGDLGRFDTPIIRDPAVIDHSEFLVMESTYGDRSHAKEDPESKLESVLRDAWENGSAVLVPSFSIGRTQELLYYLRQLQNAGRMPRVPVFLDSPMAVSATQLYAQAKEEHDEDMKVAVADDASPLDPDGLVLVRDRDQSKALNRQRGPLLIIAGSGMANGGRIIHHLKHRISDPSTIVLFTGYQAEGTLGRRILEGEPQVRIQGEILDVRARIEKMNALSAHAGQDEILHWCGRFQSAPKTTFLVHGEPPAQQALRSRLEADLGWNVEVPAFGDRFTLE